MKFLFLLGLLIAPLLHAKDNLWTRPVLVGASLSACFHHSEFSNLFKAPKSEALSLDRYLGRAIVAPHGEIKNFGTKLVFLSGDPTLKKNVERAIEKKPTVVFAIDYLFWYVYGDPKKRGKGMDELSDEEFLARGLSHLEAFKCPVILGDIPDGEKSVGLILSEKEYPGADAIQKANLQIDEWLKRQPQVVRLPLAAFLSQAVENQEITIAGEVTPAGKSQGRFLQQDLLHPTQDGAAAIILKSLEELRKMNPFPNEEINWKLGELLPPKK
ncbi:hypothetical protein N9940_01010 [bacterium]|nr:hypothetical protein [bacterium]